MIDVGGPELFACDECPIVAEFELRMGIAINHPEYGEFQFEHSGCDKVSDEFFLCGYCEDAWVGKPEKKKSGKRRTGRAYRRQMRAAKFNRQMDIILHRNTMSMTYGIDKAGLPAANVWRLWKFNIDEDDTRKTYIKRLRPSKYRKFYKNYSNRVIRRSGAALSKGNQHRKLFDYWWTIT